MESAGPADRHAHAWTVVTIGNEPVGITCSCGDSRGLGRTRMEPRSIELVYGQEYLITIEGHVSRAAISSYSMQSAYRSATELDVSFRILEA